MTTKTGNVQKLIDAAKPGPLLRAAAEEVGQCLDPVIDAHPEYQKARVFERLMIPDRIIRFRVEWVDDNGGVQINNAWRIEHSNLLGPYKGGLRFHPTVTEDTLRFLAFEQCFKNAISGLPMGGGKGGSDFDPKGKSDNEVMRFCQSFMRELYRHIGPHTDVPAGDIGVGGREIGYLYGQYMKITKLRDGVLTGKAMGMGGVHGRTEATGYGTVVFAKYMLEHAGDTIKGKRCVISGCGNVSLYAAERCLKEGAVVVSLSDSGGSLIIDKGLTVDQLEELKNFKEVQRGRLKDFKGDGMVFHPEARPWSLVKGDVAMPCATQFEVDEDDANGMIARGIKCVSEGANMPSTPEAIDVYNKNGVIYGLGKAANAGGVSCSCFEMTQNATHEPWTPQRAFDAIDGVMRHIHDLCVKHAPVKDGVVDYVTGANRAGFIIMADAMVATGV